MSALHPETTKISMTAAFIAVALFAPVFWMLLDRDPPYVRTSGEMIPANPEPGAFVSVKWTIQVERVCSPSVPRNVTRTVVDAKGVIHDYEPVDGIYGTKNQETAGGITREFQLPLSIAQGHARYHSSACFACNPIQHFWPVCIDTPDIPFDIGWER